MFSQIQPININNRIQMSYHFTDLNFFPTSDNTTSSIMDEPMLTDEMREYLQCNPTKDRLTTNWMWNAPEKIRRTYKEPGYALAYTDLGMGHWNILYWNHISNRWHIRLMGGANGHSATDRYTDMITNGFKDTGIQSNIAEWMETFQKEQPY